MALFAPLRQRTLATIQRALQGRGMKTFAYLAPGDLAPRRHRFGWSEKQRYEVWNTEGLPEKLENGLPEKAQGRFRAFWDESIGGVEVEMETLRAKHPDTFMIHALQSVVRDRGNSPLTAAEWEPFLQPFTQEERDSVASEDQQRAAVRSIHKEVGSLMKELDKKEFDALDSGSADLAMPLTEEQREALQEAELKDVFVGSLHLLRRLSLMASVVATTEDHGLAVMEQRAVDSLPISLPLAPLSFPNGGTIPGEDIVQANDYLRKPLTEGEFENLNHNETYEEMREQILAHGDRAAFLPRKILPTPLHKDAPNRLLEDTARVIDENPSLSESDKAYILQHYADALAGKAEAFDLTPENKAFLHPQPQWGVYDPELVKRQDDATDSLFGQGKFSQARGHTVSQERISPSSLGLPDLNPTRGTLQASEETAAFMAAHEAKLRAEVDTVTSRVTEALERSMGLKPGRLNASIKGQAGGAAQLEAVQRKTAEAVSGGKQQQQQQKQKAGASEFDPKDIVVPEGMSAETAQTVVASFFSKYTAGHRVPMPQPPATGHRRLDPPAKEPAPKVDTKAAGKKGKK